MCVKRSVHPAKPELAGLVSQGRDAEALQAATAILARWPESEPARKFARMLEARRDTEEGRRLLDQAEAARSKGDAVTALTLFHRAVKARLDDGERGRAQRAVAEFEHEEREREDTRQAVRVEASLGDHDKHARARSLAAYAALDEALRDRVRGRAKLPVLEWIEEMLSAGNRAVAVVDAAHSHLERAAALEDAAAKGGTGIARPDPAPVLALLAPHDRALESVPFARHLATVIQERAAEDRRHHAVEILALAEDALNAHDAEQSRRLLERAGSGLGRGDLARADALRARLALHTEGREQLERKFERLHASQQYADARRTAEALAAHADGPEQAKWIEVARTYRARIRREHHVKVFDLDAGAECSRGSHIVQYPPAWFGRASIYAPAWSRCPPSHGTTFTFVPSRSRPEGW